MVHNKEWDMLGGCQIASKIGAQEGHRKGGGGKKSKRAGGGGGGGKHKSVNAPDATDEADRDYCLKKNCFV
jgi:hypothetical protein